MTQGEMLRDILKARREEIEAELLEAEEEETKEDLTVLVN